MNLLETVLDYILQTEVVVEALKHFRENSWNEVRKLDDLEQLMARFPQDQTGNTALAQHLWGYNFWTRAQQLRELARYFRRIGVVDQERLKQWALTSTFKNDFEGDRARDHPRTRRSPGSKPPPLRAAADPPVLPGR
jgi:hypothetical protein